MGKKKKTALLTNHTQQIINFCPPKPADKKKKKADAVNMAWNCVALKHGKTRKRTEES